MPCTEYFSIRNDFVCVSWFCFVTVSEVKVNPAMIAFPTYKSLEVLWSWRTQVVQLTRNLAYLIGKEVSPLFEFLNIIPVSLQAQVRLKVLSDFMSACTWSPWKGKQLWALLKRITELCKHFPDIFIRKSEMEWPNAKNKIKIKWNFHCYLLNRFQFLLLWQRNRSHDNVHVFHISCRL